MKTLSFKLYSNNKLEIDTNTNYFIKDDVLNFKIENDTYKYDLKSDNLVKTNHEYTIDINLANKLVLIALNGYTFEMNIIEHNIKKEDNLIELEYTYEGEEITNNKIKYVHFNGDAYNSYMKKVWFDKIKTLTGWDDLKIRRRNLRP